MGTTTSTPPARTTPSCIVRGATMQETRRFGGSWREDGRGDNVGLCSGSVWELVSTWLWCISMICIYWFCQVVHPFGYTYRKMSYASPTLTPAITDLPYMVISRLRATAHLSAAMGLYIQTINFEYREDKFKISSNSNSMFIFWIYLKFIRQSCFCFILCLYLEFIQSILSEKYMLKFNH